MRTERNRGVRIPSTSLQSLVEVFQIRLMLETPLASRATQLKDPAFSAAVEESYEAFRRAAESGESGRVLRANRDSHCTLLREASNAKANQLLSEQRNFVLNTGVGTVPTSRTPLECFEDHLDIMVAFREGRPQDVSAAVVQHISHTATMLIAQESRDRTEFGDAGSAEAIEWLVHD